MQTIRKIAIMTAVAFLSAVPVVADDTTPTQVSFVAVDTVDAQDMALKTQALALKRLEFELFAKRKLQQLDQNHIFSRSRMEIVKQLDGTYRARYHQIDDSTMGVEVNRSQSGAIPYVGVLSYQEQVFESIASSIEQLKHDSFALVEIIPNRHIFSYQKGSWK